MAELAKRCHATTTGWWHETGRDVTTARQRLTAPYLAQHVDHDKCHLLNVAQDAVCHQWAVGARRRSGEVVARGAKVGDGLKQYGGRAFKVVVWVVGAGGLEFGQEFLPLPLSPAARQAGPG